LESGISGINIDERRQYSNPDRFLHLLWEAFQQSGWNAMVHPQIGNSRADLVVERGGLRYIIELKWVSVGKRARLLPLLSMAILEAKAAADSQADLRPMAVVMAPHIEEKLAGEIREFAFAHAPDVAVGVVDFDGLRRFWGEGLDNLNSERPPDFQGMAIKGDEAGSNLFSDVNQWLLKVLLGQQLPQEVIHVPRGEFRNASQLAELADVSVMSAFRFLRQLENEGFLAFPRLANVDRLLHRWQAAMLKPQKEIRCRWLIPGGNEERLVDAIRQWSHDNVGRGAVDALHFQEQLRLCLGGFLAASWLGFGHVSGAPPLVYIERMNAQVLRRLGLARIEDSRPADVLVRVPSFRQSLFRAAVVRNEVRVSDVLQVWLESSVNPARGAEQANLIKRRLLDPLLRENL
jgi:hypothetical protein